MFLVSTYIVKADKQKEHTVWGKNLVTAMKANSELFGEVKSLRVLSQKIGNARRYMAIWEFKNQTDRKSWEKKLHKLKEGTELTDEFRALLEPESFSSTQWKSVKSMRRVPAP